MASITDLFKKQSASIDLPPGEHEGPIVINHPCVVNGGGATLWTKQGPVLTVVASDVTLKNIRIELTEKADNAVAVNLEGKNIRLEEVEVYGQIQRPEGVSQWDLPRMVDFGSFAADKPNEYCRHVRVATPCRLECEMYGLTVTPTDIKVGDNDIIFSLAPMASNTVVYGSFLLRAADGVIKRIYLSGQAIKGAREFHEIAKQKTVHPAAAKPKTSQVRNGAVLGIVTPPLEPKGNWQTAVKGQRLPLTAVKECLVTLWGDVGSLQIDPYAFQLYANGKTRSDSDLIFFGNPQDRSMGVYQGDKEGKPGIGVCLSSVPPNVHRIVISFAVYDEESRPGNDFSRLRGAQVLLFIDGVPGYKLPLSLGNERVINAMEIYRYKSDWKVNFIGAGFTAGLRKMCEIYGIEVV